MANTDDPTPNRELVIYALHLLGGAVERVHTEDIAIKAHELFPDSFSWTKHPGLPDKDIVRVALTDARKEKYGSLIEGRTGQHKGQSVRTNREPTPDGWILTEAGVQWVRLQHERLEQLAGSSGSPKEHRQKLLKQLARIRSHPLFAEYTRQPERFAPDIGGLAELFRCRVDASHEVWTDRLLGVRRRARAAEQSDILAFVDACEKAYNTQR